MTAPFLFALRYIPNVYAVQAIDVSKQDEQFHRLYGIAFDPQFEQNRYCYLSYVLTPKLPDGSRANFKVKTIERAVMAQA